MPGESSGFACRAPLEQRDRIRIGKVHFLDVKAPAAFNVVNVIVDAFDAFDPERLEPAHSNKMRR